MSADIKGQVVHSDIAGTGPAVNAETGQVTQSGEPLPPIQQEGGHPLAAVETPMPAILKNGIALHLVLQAADLRGLPLPFAIRADNVWDNFVTLQFHTHAEVVTWAEVLEVSIDEILGKAVGEWLEVQVEVCTTDRVSS